LGLWYFFPCVAFQYLYIFGSFFFWEYHRYPYIWPPPYLYQHTRKQVVMEALPEELTTRQS
jgi:hypothetical protein